MGAVAIDVGNEFMVGVRELERASLALQSAADRLERTCPAVAVEVEGRLVGEGAINRLVQDIGDRIDSAIHSLGRLHVGDAACEFESAASYAEVVAALVGASHAVIAADLSRRLRGLEVKASNLNETKNRCRPNKRAGR